MFKFSAVSQIWKKYIQKLNDWDLPLIKDRCPFILFLNSPSPTNFNPQRAHSIAYTTLYDLQDRSSKLCVKNERLVRLIEKELLVMRILMNKLYK